MGFRNFLSILLIFFLAISTVSAAAKAPKKKMAASTSSKRTVATSSKAKKKTASRSGRSSRTPVKARRAAPPRQAHPSNERYAQIQRALAGKGFYDGEIDGQWDEQSVMALKRFQESENLSANGKLTSRSLISLGLGPQRQPLSSSTGGLEPVPAPAGEAAP